MAAEADEVRRLRWEGSHNIRDLGGFPLRNGGETRRGAVVRADNLAKLTDAGRASLEAHGVRTIVDLRNADELRLDPPPFRDHDSIAYHHIPFIAPGSPPPNPAAASPPEDYITMLTRFGPRVAEIMRTIARAPEGVVLFHCHGGKDRTGLIAALLLDLAGVRRETIAADYALTTDYLRETDADWLANGPGERADRERLYETWKARPETMLSVLEHLDAQYGGVEGYLRSSGLDGEDIDRLRERLGAAP